ncbi:P-loop containing nucleoside triphosphate hydrolases superfamily protein isoform 1 [Hibiscus syriacus]|uniref:P-loop containing nucleoside triphosphate hydrolases superfamily protein isoform 1 n=1 Tax=Hibiscus syriacus TaxID=106335 RepID=A0A6A3BHX1_HIBSY|nr:P-loop containing nucleoside triphosphate hydrolases superfamily protein isoform 1 [Hibiscus syriacus]
MAVQKLKERTLMIKVLIFHAVLCSSLHGCFAAIVNGQPLSNRSTLHPMAVNSFGSSVYLPVSGNVYPLGYYSVTVEIGNPPKQFQLDIDTDLAWVQCDAPCVGCTLPRYRRYKPAKNNYVLCREPICAAVHSPNPPPCKNPTDKCSFQVEYADHVSVSGAVVSDIFPHALSMARCGYGLHGSGTHPPPPTTGVLGLGRSKPSISTQLSSMGIAQNILGHCFNDKGGYLFFGADFIPKSGMTWTPVSQSSSDKHYSLGPAEVLFHGKPTGIKDLHVIFDTGSTYTYLSSGVYGSVLNLIRKDASRKPVQEVKDKALPICWKGSRLFKSVQDVQNYFSPLALSFAGNIQLQLSPEAYLVVTEQGNVCLGILNGTEVGLGTVNVIGDISLQSKVMIYDNKNQRMGWAYEDCTPKFG